MEFLPALMYSRVSCKRRLQQYVMPAALNRAALFYIAAGYHSFSHFRASPFLKGTMWACDRSNWPCDQFSYP